MAIDEMVEDAACATADRLEALIQLANEATGALKGEFDHPVVADPAPSASRPTLAGRLKSSISSLARLIAAALPNVRELQQRERMLELMQSRLQADVDGHAAMIRVLERESLGQFNQHIESTMDAAMDRLREEIGAGRRLMASMRDAEARLNGLSATLTAQVASLAATAWKSHDGRLSSSAGSLPSTSASELSASADRNRNNPGKDSEPTSAGILLAIYEDLERELRAMSQAARALQSTVHAGDSDKAVHDLEFAATLLRDVASGIPTALHVDTGACAGIATAEVGSGGGPIDLRAMIDRLVEYYSEREPGAVRVKSEIAFDVPALVLGDEACLRRVIGSLLTTSRRLANEGTIMLRLGAEELADDRLALRGEFCHENADVPPHQIPDLNQLEAIQSTTSREHAGRGMGLFMARALLESVKGSLTIESQTGRSFQIRFTIPVFRHNGRSDSRRTSNRLRLENVTSSIGPVLDLSRGGARISCTRPPDERFTLEISDESTTVSLEAERVWLNRVGWRRYEVGLRFGRLSADQSERLTRLCVQNRVRRTLEEA